MGYLKRVLVLSSCKYFSDLVIIGHGRVQIGLLTSKS